ncbi:MAG: DNA mismatch repair endonuclease MutL, partial [Nitrospinota bacterium]
MNRIAAGEVVERPASVVKELVENSLDAGASRVEVEVRGGGREYIGVLDDGCGMSRGDAELALERHATSKLRSEDDLTRISSLGFRGEALPSIAAVSKLKLTTCSEDSPMGIQVAVEGGVIKGVSEAGCPRGTFLQVEELFFNTPARLKFLKKPSTELARIGETLTLLALSHPEVGFTLRHDGRFLLEVSPQDPPSRVSSLLGRELFSQLLPLGEASGELSLKGFIAPPSFNRPRRSLQYLFVNGRPVKDPTASQALYEGYRGQLPQGRHPVYLVFLELP